MIKKTVLPQSTTNVIEYKNNFISRMNSQNSLQNNNRFNTPINKIGLCKNPNNNNNEKLFKKNNIKKS